MENMSLWSKSVHIYKDAWTIRIGCEVWSGQRERVVTEDPYMVVVMKEGCIIGCVF